MKNLNLTEIEETLKGKLSTNPDRFEEATGIIFTLNELTEEIEDYFYNKGIEFYKLVNGVYYTETILSLGEFRNLDHIEFYKVIV